MGESSVDYMNHRYLEERYQTRRVVGRRYDERPPLRTDQHHGYMQIPTASLNQTPD